MLKTKTKAAPPRQPLTKRPMPSVETTQPQDLPELDCLETASAPDSPAPETPPTTHIELDVFNLTHKSDGPLTHMVKEVEECWAEWHHVDEHGIRTDGEVGIVGRISPI